MARKALYAVKRPENWLLEPPSTSGPAPRRREGGTDGRTKEGGGINPRFLYAHFAEEEEEEAAAAELLDANISG